MAWPTTTTTTTAASATITSAMTTINITTNNITSNDSLADGGGNTPGPLVSLTIPLLMFCTGVLGNLVALVLLWRSRRENARSVFYRLVAGLAVTDLLGTLATSPVPILVYSNNRQWVGGQPVCNYFSFMLIWAGLATVIVVGCMALERYLAILHPYLYERRMSPERVKYVMASVWLSAVLFSCLPLVGVGRNVKQFPGTWCFFDFYSDRVVDRVFSFVYASIGLVVIAATAVCNVAVMAVLLRMRRVSKNIGKSSEGRTLVNMTSEMQMIFFLAGIILVFATCYSPLMVRVMINASKTVPISEESDLMAIRLASLNQILDPWVYLLFRRRVANLLYSACKTVSPLQNMSSFKAFRSEFGNSSLRNSSRNSPALQRNSSGKGKRDSGKGVVAATDVSPLAVANGHCTGGSGGEGLNGGSVRESTATVTAGTPLVANGDCHNQDRGGSQGSPAVLNLLNEAGHDDGEARQSTDLAEAGGCGEEETRRYSSGTYPARCETAWDNVDYVHPDGPVVRTDCCELPRSLELGQGDVWIHSDQNVVACEAPSPTKKLSTSLELGKDERDGAQCSSENSTHGRDCMHDDQQVNVVSDKHVRYSGGERAPLLLDQPQTCENSDSRLRDRDTNSVSGDSAHGSHMVGVAAEEDEDPESYLSGVTDTAELVPRDPSTCTDTESAVQLHSSLPAPGTSSPTSWPVVCRHGNHVMVKGGKSSPTGSGECLPLLDPETVATPCGQCERDSEDTAFV